MQNDRDIPISDDRSEILTWLSPLEPQLRHHDIRTDRVKDVGDWLLRTREFRRWKTGGGRSGSQKATIFCSGNLGVGKTYISTLVIDTLCDEPGEGAEDIAVACFYFNFAARKEQSAANVLGALLKQIVGGFKKIPKEITDAFQRHKKLISGRKLQLSAMVKMLGSYSSTQPTFFCLDGLDECAAPDRAKLLLSLKEIIRTSPTIRVFLTGRPHVGGEVEKHLAGGVEFVSTSPRKGDITQFIRMKLAEDTTLDEIDERLEAEIVNKLPGTAGEIFLLVSLNLDTILQEVSIRRRWERLRAVTEGLALESAYSGTLERVKAQGGQKSRLGVTALMWICHSERPLVAEELCQALAVEIGATDCDPANASSIRTVLSCCQGLAMMDKEGSTVRLIHHTLQEYLTSHCNLFQSPHSAISETCLTYLNSHQIMALSDVSYPPFLQYSSLYWGVHMKKEPSGSGKTLALKLFSRYKYHASIRLLLEHTLGPDLYPIEDFCMFTGLHCASIFGLFEVVRPLTEMGADINCLDETGSTPLIWAAKSGHKEMMNLLLKRRDVDPNMPDGNGQTLISWAAANGNETVVKLLLGRKDVNPDKPDSYGQTPISRAAENGHEEVVKIFLGREDINPDSLDSCGRTAIWWAAGNGHKAVVQLLLRRKDVNPDRPDRIGQTPLSFAAESGREAVAKLLLERQDVSPDRPDKWGETPISLAARNGHKEVVELLRRHKDTNPDRRDI